MYDVHTSYRPRHPQGSAKHSEGAQIASSPRDLKRISRQVTSGAKDAAGSLGELGNEYTLALIVACAAFGPCLPHPHVAGSAQIRVSVTAPDLQATEFV